MISQGMNSTLFSLIQVYCDQIILDVSLLYVCKIQHNSLMFSSQFTCLSVFLLLKKEHFHAVCLQLLAK